MQRMKQPAQNKITSGKNPGHRFAEHCDISSALRWEFMNTVEQMSAHHPQPATAPIRKSFESFRCRPDPIWIHRENCKRTVLPLDNPLSSECAEKSMPRDPSDAIIALAPCTFN